MRGKSLALLALALGCGLIASLGITQVMAKRGEPTAGAETQNVLVAAKDVPLGDVITAHHVKAEPWPKDKVPPGTLVRMEDVEGRKARAKFFAGEPILEQKLLSKDASAGGYDALIPKGYRVVSVRVDKVSGGGLILPGSRVDLLMHVTRNPAMGFAETTTKTILEDIKVFAVNDVVSAESSGGETKSIAASTVSLLVTPKQAEKITLATELGNIRLVMRPPEDDSKTHGLGATTTDLFGGDGSNRKNESLMPMETTPAKPQNAAGLLAMFDSMKKGPATATAGPAKAASDKPKWSVRVLKGSEVQDIPMEQSDELTAGGSGLSIWKTLGSTAAKPEATEVTKLETPEPRPGKSEPKLVKPVPKSGKAEAKPAVETPKSAKDDKKPSDNTRKS